MKGNCLNRCIVNQVFDTLDEWQSLPGHQLEGRADVFFSVHLTEIISKHFSLDKNNLLIIPELPTRSKLSGESVCNHISSKIDYLVVDKVEKKLFFVVVKTYMSSINIEQVKMMNSLYEVSLKDVIDDIISFSKNGNEPDKYKVLLTQLAECGWVDGILEGDVRNTAKDDYSKEVFYILPRDPEDELGDMKYLTFRDCIESIKSSRNMLTQRFMTSLRRWSKGE